MKGSACQACNVCQRPHSSVPLVQVPGPKLADDDRESLALARIGAEAFALQPCWWHASAGERSLYVAKQRRCTCKGEDEGVSQRKLLINIKLAPDVHHDQSHTMVM